MTKQDFELIADIVRHWLVDYPDRQKATANAFADVLQRTNPRFDRARFLKACGVES